ncbi:hypothetical protein IscW_ISCW001430 [Ixodes scapularis]|uniref:Uncharacterized protein n=1 Tax=Ixodes scapularis TaxID=6945 RepID=B7P244_IXOSC|nr:hypothetical protein IscW_ISCW001430 [Ixodes scapularis]|eukprot:XP_002401466.1 hypothetical protein IscW_ISCW001430 [Ixodes scapularis]
MKAAAGPLLALALLACSLLACGAKVLGHRTPLPSPRSKRSLRWQDISDAGPDDSSWPDDGQGDSNAGSDDAGDGNGEHKGGSGYYDQPQIGGSAYQEEWLMDSFLPHIHKTKLRKNKSFPDLSKYRLFPSDVGEESGQNRREAASSESSVSSSASTSAKFPSISTPAKQWSEATSADASSVTSITSSSAAAGIRMCASEATSNSPHTDTTKTHTAKAESAKTAPATAATKKVKISAVASAPQDDSGKFVINRYAQVEHHSAYMEYMDPMKSYACRWHIWIIAILCALLLLLAVVHLAPRTPAPESLLPQEPALSPPTPPLVPKAKSPEIWEDDIYDVSETVKMGRSPSLEGHETVH